MSFALGRPIRLCLGKNRYTSRKTIKNEKLRRTYYGALDYQTKEFLVKEYSSGNTENTIEFLKYLQSQRPGKRLAIFWDGATYHKSQEFQEYLSKINQDLSE